MEHTLYLSSQGASSYANDSSPCEFTVQLARPLYLNEGKWVCCLSEFNCSIKPKSMRRLLVCYDICNESCVGSSSLPVLGLASLSSSVKKPLTDTYVTLKRDMLSSITLYIKDGIGRNLSADIGHVDCTLRLKQIQS